MMSDKIRQMLATAYDLEGLLLLADSREHEMPEMVIGKIIEKIGDLSAMSASLRSGSDKIKENASAGLEPEAAIPEAKQTEAKETKSLQSVCTAAEPIADYTLKETEKQTGKEAAESLSETATAERDTECFHIPEEPEENQENYTDEETVHEKPVSSPAFIQGTVGSRASRLEEILQRNRSKDLRSAFSINDMFRFRRELFGNSAAEMADTINLVDAMSTFAEAEDYFYGDLGWDAESEEVAEFMTIIRNHFL